MENMHNPDLMCAFVGEKKVCMLLEVAVTVCVHTFVYVWVWRAVLTHTDLCQKKDVFLN